MPPKTDQYGPDYIPGLYIKSDYEFKAAPEDIEQAIDAFETAIQSAQKMYRLLLIIVLV